MSQTRSLVILFASAVVAAACTTPSSPPQTTTTTVTVTPPSSGETAPPADQPLADPPPADPAEQPLPEPGKPPPVAKAPQQDPSAAPGLITCTPEMRKQMCAQQYDPVCGVVDMGIRCIRAPCPSTAEQTFSNACTACAEPKTSGYRAGACTTPSPQGNQPAVK